MKDQTWAGTYPEQKRPISMETVRSSTHTSVMIFKWVQPDHEGMKTAPDENGQKSCEAVADRRLSLANLRSIVRFDYLRSISRQRRVSVSEMD